jgi:aldehyde dehydrogenase (NAD+)
MGSKDALVVMEDGDLDLAVACALNGAFGGTGQKCTASSRLIVHHAVHDAFVEKMTDGMKALKVGHALEDGTQIGPVVDARQLQGNMAYVELAREEGCVHVWGGEQLARETGGQDDLVHR